MINKLEEKSTMNKMSDLEFGKNSVEMMRYRDNKLSYGLGFLGLGFSVFAAFIYLNSMFPETFQVILAILLNVVLLLFGFLCIEKTKAYSKQGAISLIVIGGINVLQIFWIPLNIITTYNKWQDLLDKAAKIKTTGTSEEYTAAVKAASDYATANVGKVIYEGSANNVHWLFTNGNFRGITAMVLLILSAACFIAAGVYGYLRAKKLYTYLDSIKVKR